MWCVHPRRRQLSEERPFVEVEGGQWCTDRLDEIVPHLAENCGGGDAGGATRTAIRRVCFGARWRLASQCEKQVGDWATRPWWCSYMIFGERQAFWQE